MKPEAPVPAVRMATPGAGLGFPSRNQSRDLTSPARAVALEEPAVEGGSELDTFLHHRICSLCL